MQIIKWSILTQNSKNPSIVAVLFLTSLEYIQPLHRLHLHHLHFREFYKYNDCRKRDFYWYFASRSSFYSSVVETS